MGLSAKIIIGAIVALLILFPVFIGCERIDAGHVGVKVNLYGSDRGVQDVEQVAGMVWYFRPSTSVYEFPTFVQQAKWANAQDKDGNWIDNAINCTTSDGMNIKFDIGVNYYVVSDRVSDIFKKYRRSLEEIQEQYFKTTIRNAYNTIASGMTAEELINKRSVYENSVRALLDSLLKPEGIIVQQATIYKVTVPKQLENAINSKIEAVQNAQRVENELMQTRAEAAKREAEATGYANSLMIRAKADADANRLKQATLTPLLIQQQFIERWDGQLPKYGTVPQLFKDISK